MGEDTDSFEDALGFNKTGIGQVNKAIVTPMRPQQLEADFSTELSPTDSQIITIPFKRNEESSLRTMKAQIRA